MRRATGMSRFRAGVITLVVLALAVYFGVTKELPFGSSYRVQAVFSDAASQVRGGTAVRPGSPVRIAGVDVGAVRSVERGPGTTVLVDMEIEDKGRPVHRDATAAIRPRLFLEGNFFVELEPGSPGAGDLEDGGSIPLAQTSVPVQFDQVLGILRDDTRGRLQDMLEGFADALDEGGADALNRGYPDWAPAFRSSAVAAEALRGREHDDLSTFVREQAGINAQLASRREQLGGLLSGVRRTMAAFADRQGELGATLRTARDLLDEAPAALRDVDRLLPPLRTVADAARPALRIAPGVLDRSGPFLDQLSGLLADPELPSLARALRPATAGLRGLNERLPALLELVDPVSRCVGRNIVETLNKTVPDGIHTTEQPVWQEGLRFGVSLVGSQQNFDGNGTTTRYSAGIDQSIVTAGPAAADGIVHLMGEPMLGARPKWTPGRQPPLRPDAPCEDQAVPSLEAETAPPPARQRRITLRQVEDPWTIGDLRRRMTRLVKDGQRKLAKKLERLEARR